MGRRRTSEFTEAYERNVDLTPRAAARTYQQRVQAYRDLRDGRAKPAHAGDTIEHRLEVARLWRDALRAVGVCKKCGERLTGTSPEARLARARNVGPTCWVRKCTPEERAEIDAWVARHQDLLADEPV
jgi:hypothetical protein